MWMIITAFFYCCICAREYEMNHVESATNVHQSPFIYDYLYKKKKQVSNRKLHMYIDENQNIKSKRNHTFQK